MDSPSHKDTSAANLLRQSHLLRSENLALQKVVDIKTQRLKHITQENLYLYTHLRQQVMRGNDLLQEVNSLRIITCDSPSKEQS